MLRHSTPMERFIRGYIEALLWQATDPDDGESIAHLHLSAKEEVKASVDAVAFFTDHRDLWADEPYFDDEQAGECFALSRNGHGTGFFDSDITKANELQLAARVYGPATFAPNEDGVSVQYMEG